MLYGEPFLTKPPGQYAAIGLCSLPFGEVTAVTARIPSIIAATLSVFLVYGMFRRAINEQAALLAALLLPTSILWLDKVPSAEIDMTLVGWVTAAIACFHWAIRAPGQVSFGALCLALLCVAGGTLTKWTAPAFFYLTVVPFLAWRGELRVLFGWRHLLACAIGVGACAAWVFAVSQQIGWEALVETIRKEAAYRFSPKSASRGYPWGDVGTYPALVIAAHLPVAFFALLTFRPGFVARWDDRGKLLLQLLHCWTWPNLLFWTLVPNHNVRYALPMSPGLMGLGVMGLIGCLRDTPAREFATRLFLAVWIVAKFAFVELAVAQRTEKHNAEPIAAELRTLIPADQTVYLFRMKDEGVMFYLNRPGVRLHNPRDLPRNSLAILIQPEWQDRAAFGHLELIHWTRDQQGDALFLVRAP